jgi:tetratricopeptide (TPR) repeat protein
MRAEAYRIYNSGRYADAIPYLSALLEQKPRDIEAHIKRGNSYLRLNQPEAAFADFNWVVGFKPTFPPAYTDRGIANLMLSRLDAAAADFRMAIRLYDYPPPLFNPATGPPLTAYDDPFWIDDNSWNVINTYAPGNIDRWGTQRALAHSGLGQVYHRMGRNDLALTEYNRSLQFNPLDPNAQVGRADALAGLGQAEQALAGYDDALRLAPNDSRAYSGRGEARARSGQTEAALADFGRAIALDPTFARARRLRASVLSGEGRHEQALADLDALIQADRADVGARKDRGGVLVRMGKPKQAIVDLDEALRLDPQRIGAYVNRGTAYSALGQPARAIHDFDRAVALDPTNIAAFTNRGLARAALGESERALSDLGEAIRIAPDNGLVHFNRAEVYTRLKRYDDAIHDYETAVRLAPGAAEAHAGLAGVLDITGRHVRAEREFGEAIRLMPRNVGLYLRRADARRALRDWNGAIADVSSALGIDPHNAFALDRRGWWRLIANKDGADEDARAFLGQHKTHDTASSYTAILGTLASRRVEREAEGSEFLSEALAGSSLQVWPVPILRYLNRSIDANELLSGASSPWQATESHVFVGLDLLFAGRNAEAFDHLRWARDNGADSPVALDLARETLGRLDKPTPRP